MGTQVSIQKSQVESQSRLSIRPIFDPCHTHTQVECRKQIRNCLECQAFLLAARRQTNPGKLGLRGPFGSFWFPQRTASFPTALWTDSPFLSFPRPQALRPAIACT